MSHEGELNQETLQTETPYISSEQIHATEKAREANRTIVDLVEAMNGSSVMMLIESNAVTASNLALKLAIKKTQPELAEIVKVSTEPGEIVRQLREIPNSTIGTRVAYGEIHRALLREDAAAVEDISQALLRHISFGRESGAGLVELEEIISVLANSGHGEIALLFYLKLRTQYRDAEKSELGEWSQTVHDFYRLAKIAASLSRPAEAQQYFDTAAEMDRKWQGEPVFGATFNGATAKRTRIAAKAAQLGLNVSLPNAEPDQRKEQAIIDLASETVLSPTRIDKLATGFIERKGVDESTVSFMVDRAIVSRDPAIVARTADYLCRLIAATEKLDARSEKLPYPYYLTQTLIGLVNACPTIELITKAKKTLDAVKSNDGPRHLSLSMLAKAATKLAEKEWQTVATHKELDQELQGTELPEIGAVDAKTAALQEISSLDNDEEREAIEGAKAELIELEKRLGLADSVDDIALIRQRIASYTSQEAASVAGQVNIQSGR